MNRSLLPAQLSNERGVALVMVFVFLLLLSLTTFSGAFSIVTHTQVVRNIENERRAFYVAEAGIAEAKIRLNMSSPTMVTVDGKTFDAAIVPEAREDWAGYLQFSGTGPAKSASTLKTPTIQRAANRLAYSTEGQDEDTLMLRWALDDKGKILKINGQSVLDVTAVGRSGSAKRSVHLQMAEVLARPSIHVNSTTACPGLKTNGNPSIRTGATIQVNSTCSGAIQLGGSSDITAATGQVKVAGGIGGKGKISPVPATGSPVMPDPLGSLKPPCFAGYAPAGCIDLGLKTKSNSTYKVSGKMTLEPGVYYGGIDVKGGTASLNPGVYVMAGGGFSVSANGSSVVVNDPKRGVMIYNTRDPAGGKMGAVSFNTGSGNVNLRAEPDGPYRGIVIFQDRDATPQPAVTVQGGFSGVLDGTIYAINAALDMQGGSSLQTEMVVGTLTMGGNATILPPPHPSTAGSTFASIAWLDV